MNHPDMQMELIRQRQSQIASRAAAAGRSGETELREIVRRKRNKKARAMIRLW